MRTRRFRRSTAAGVVVALAVSLAVATPTTASAADDPSVQLPDVPAVPVSSVGQGSRDEKKDEAGQSARQGNQTGLPTSLPGEGTYAATSLSQSGKWDVAGQTGDFTWSYPLKVPPAAGGVVPSLGLVYSSSAVDGLTSASNNQASWVGDGWSLWPGFVERTYGSCQTDLPGNAKDNPADLCWKSDNATLSLNGSQTMLILDDQSKVWKPKNDNGSRIDRWTGAANGDDNGEHWRVTTTDGTQYFFGVRPEAGSTWTVPVYGDDTNEPCNKPNDFAGSSCAQGYRWQLDKVVSTNGDVMIYNYEKEMNKYGQNKNTRAGEYVRGGWLKNIQYGLRDDTPGLAASGRVVFEEAERCVPGATNCDRNNPAHRANFPDVPLELKCDGTTCKDTWSPSFWTTKRLNKIRTEVRDGDGYRPVDSWTLRHQFPYPNDENKPALWLAGITHTGHDGGDLPLPEVTFEGVRKPNRVVKPGDGASFLIRFRIGAIVSESGAVTSVNYADRNCDENTVITPGNNTLRCYPAKWNIPGVEQPRTDYFHKYVVASVSSSDWIGSELSSETTYEYVGGAAWHFDESEFTPEQDKTWNQFRGYGQVIVRTGRRSDDPRTRTKTATTFYRGMNGDKDKPPAKVTDSEGGSVDDHNWLNGTVRETITYLGDTGDVVSKTINEPYWRDKPTATRGAFEARIVRAKIARSFTMLAGGGKQETRTESFYDDQDPTAMAKSVHDFGDVSKTDDDRCITTTYARDTEKWLMGLVSEVDTVAVACGATPTFPKDAISNNRTTYDSRGNVTSTQALKARPAADRFEHVTTSKVDPADIDKHGRALKVADALGKISTSEYTPALGGPVTRTKSANPLGFGITATLNTARGVTVHATDVNQRVTESAYDPLGRLTQVWLPGRQRSGDNGSKKFGYKISRTEPNVVTTDVLGPKGLYLTSKEILDGQLRPRQTQRPTDEGRLLTETRYDVHGRAFLKTAPFFTTGAIDDKLWMASNSEAIPAHTVTEFDGASRPVAEVFKAPTEKWRSTTTYGGNWVKLTPPPGGVPTTTLFDARGQVVERRTDAPQSTQDTTSYRYTTAGQLSEVKDPENNTWRNEYDLLGRLVVQDDPDKGVTRKTYNDLNQVVETKDALDVVLRTTYDDMGRPKLNERVFPDNRPAEKLSEWTYDTVGGFGKGLPASVTRWIGATPYTSSVMSYDRAGRATSTQLVIPDAEKDKGIAGTYLTSMRYNPDGSLQSTTLPAVGVPGTPGALDSETVLHEYDDFGRIKSTTGGPADQEPFNYVANTVYTKYGEPQQLWLGDDGQRSWLTTLYESDTRRPKRTIVDTQTAKPMQADINYTYNPAGLVTSVADQPLEKTPDIQCFSYDHLQRLTSAWTPQTAAEPCAAAPSTGNLAGPAPYWQSFAYDKVGNRITDAQHSAQGDTVRTYAKGDAHELKSVSTARPGLAAASVDTPTYDPTGNTLTRKTPAGVTQLLEWDVEGRLAKVTEGNKVVAEFVYGATGERLIRREPGAASTTVYLAGQELQVRGTVKTATRYYSHGGRVVASRSGDRLDYVATDHQGTVNTSIDASTLKVERRRQLPFGGPRGPQGDFAGDKGFVGGTVDSTAGFTTLGARQYDPDTGRFLSVDPIGDPSDAQQMHGYTYSANSPLTKSDPSGLLAIPCLDGGPCANPNTGKVPGGTPQATPNSPTGRWAPPPPTPRRNADARIPDGASPDHQIAWINRYRAQMSMESVCGLGGPNPLGRGAFQCMLAQGQYDAASAAYDKLLSKERTEASNRELGEAISRTVKVPGDALAFSICLNPGMWLSCFRPSGTTAGACGTTGGMASLGISTEGCLVMDDKGIGVVSTEKIGADGHVLHAGAGIKYMKGDIDYQDNHGGTYYGVPIGARGEIEVGESKDGLHSVGVYTGVYARGHIPGVNPHKTPSGGTEFSRATRLVEVPNLCSYCHAMTDGIIGVFK